MDRKPVFDAFREFMGGSLTQPEVDSLDEFLDKFRPREADRPSDIPDDYWPMLSKIESGDRLFVKAPTSSASGLYQFIKSTWIGEGGKWGPDMSHAFGGLRPSKEEQLQRAKSFTEKNAKVLRAAGLPINKASLYAAHFLGPTMAVKLVGADVNERADLIAGKNATNANPSILKNKTVGDFLTWLHKKTGEWAR